MDIQYSTFCECGKRPRNEDYIRVAELPETRRTLFVLCDGMGGHAMGDAASHTVGDVFADYWLKTPEFGDCEKKVREACHKAIMAIDRKSANLGNVQMGTTMVMASIEEDRLIIAHLGDSRCYLLRRGKDVPADTIDADVLQGCVIYQTQDHVTRQYGRELITKGFFTNFHNAVDPDIRQFCLEPGDVIFLCSDGVDRYVGPLLILEELVSDKTAGQIAATIAEYSRRMSLDNYSGIVVRVG